MQKEQRCNVFNAITGKLESDVVVFLGFLNDSFFVYRLCYYFFSQKVTTIHFCFAGKESFQFLTLGFLSHPIKILNKTHFLVQG